LAYSALIIYKLCSGGGVYVDFRLGDVTDPGGMSCSSYQLFVVVLKKRFL